MNETQFTQALIDCGCQSYATVSDSLVKSFDLPRIHVSPRSLESVIGVAGTIHFMTCFDLDVHGHRQSAVYAYIVPDQIDKMILGKPWMTDVDAIFSS